MSTIFTEIEIIDRYNVHPGMRIIAIDQAESLIKWGETLCTDHIAQVTPYYKRMCSECWTELKQELKPYRRKEAQ